MKDWKEYALIALIALAVVYIYHHGWVNVLLPGKKKVTKGVAKKEQAYILAVATGAPGSVALSQDEE